MQQFLNSMYNALGAALAFLYSLVPNLGVAIVLLTVGVMVVLYPLTAKQFKSMMAMQRVQPEIKKLQAKYKGDRQKLNEEMMRFYQENHINPLSGCLPLLVQMPVFFLLYRVLRDPYKHVPKTGSFNQLYNAFCSGYQNFCGKTVTAAQGQQVGLKKGAQALHAVKFLGMDLHKTATEVHGLATALPYFVLVGLVVVTGMLQTRQQTSRTPQASKQMGTVMKILPIFFGLISLQFPAGLVLYFFISNLCRVGQQEVVWRRHGHELTPGAAGGRKLGAGAKAIDVASKDRTAEPAEPEAPPVEGNGDRPARPARTREPAVRTRAKPEKPERRPATQARSRRPTVQPRELVQEERVPGSGLRGFFQLPPPPTGNGGRQATAPTRAKGTSTRTARPARGGSGRPSSGRPPPQQRGSSKKKRKR
jgi:YidC/Oxa1 family membrane protein insertase